MNHMASHQTHQEGQQAALPPLDGENHAAATTRPLRHADDTAQELANLRGWRDRMAADLEWAQGLIEHIERGGESDVTGAASSEIRACRYASLGGTPDGSA